jgi:putative transposase
MKQWPHAPVHFVDESGTFMVTASTYKKQHLFNTDAKLQLLHDALLEKPTVFNWQLQAWAVLSNHYHFVAISPDHPENLPALIKILHGSTGKYLNDIDGTSGRKVWFQYWDSQITFQDSYYARLKYVHNNPVHHGVVNDALKYKWCSASWFELTSEISFCKTVSGMKIDRIKVNDDF